MFLCSASHLGYFEKVGMYFSNLLYNNQHFGKKEASVLLGKLTEMKTSGINKRNARGKSRLHLAARRGNLFLVKTLIESGADVNLKDNAGLDFFNFNCLYNLNSHFTHTPF